MKKIGNLQIRSNTYSEGCSSSSLSGGRAPMDTSAPIIEGTTSKKEKKLKLKTKSLTSSIGG